jgi:hypothetical protein
MTQAERTNLIRVRLLLGLAWLARLRQFRWARRVAARIR